MSECLRAKPRCILHNNMYVIQNVAYWGTQFWMGKNKEDVHCTFMFTYIQLYLYLGHVNNIIFCLFEIELLKSDFVQCMVRNCTDVLHSLSISADVFFFLHFH